MKTIDITVTNMSKQQKDGMWQVLGFRTTDALMRAVSFWVKKDEAEWIARELRTATAEAPVVVEVDHRSWVHMFSWGMGGAS